MTLIHDGKMLWVAEFDADSARAEASILRYVQAPVAEEPVAVPMEWAQAFTAYFAGEVTALRNLPIARFGSDFQRRVWGALRCIPPGQVRTYGEIARAIGGVATGKGGLARAVGLANGSNPLAILIPCHRVIGANGRLTGYAGGLARKQWLLEHERRHAGSTSDQGILL